jgi:hypothetical protein
MITTLAVCTPLAAVAASLAVLALLQRRRLRRLTSTSGLHEVLRDAHASWIVDHALKTLVEACQREPRAVPGIVMVVLHETGIEAHLSAPAAHPPAPWRTSSDGLVWSADIMALQAAPLTPTMVNPFTGLVTLGLSGSGRVFIDLGEAHGLVSIDGDPSSRRLVAARWIAETTTRPWSTGAAQLVGLDANAEPLEMPGSAIDHLTDAVASGTAGLAFIERLTNDATTNRLVRALEGDGCRWPVVVASAVPDARWRFTAHSNGWVTSDFLPAARWNPAAALPVATPAPATVTT